jgi:hypothetical protein
MCPVCDLGFAPRDAIVVLPHNQDMLHLLYFWLAWQNVYGRN